MNSSADVNEFTFYTQVQQIQTFESCLVHSGGNNKGNETLAAETRFDCEAA